MAERRYDFVEEDLCYLPRPPRRKPPTRSTSEDDGPSLLDQEAAAERLRQAEIAAAYERRLTQQGNL
jgi:hypothetical protein